MSAGADASTRPIIRPLRSADFPEWTALWDAYLRFYEADIPQATTALTWERLMDPAEPVHGAVGVDPASGRLLGFAHFIEHRSTWVATRSVYLEDLFVTAEARGLGVGHRLIDHVAEHARSIGAPHIHWLTHADNVTAQALYDRLTGGRSGFIQYQLTLDEKSRA